MFATDRDLLALEPGVFREVVWVGQRLASAQSALNGTTLVLATPGVTFAGAGPGSVVNLPGQTVEVVALVTETAATVSKLRASVDDDPIPVGTFSGETAEVVTFAPQIAQVHRQVLRMLGIEPAESAPDGQTPGEADITNPEALRQVEALGALHLVYAAAAAAGGAGRFIEDKAERYRRAFAAERQRAAARVDLDGDGVADATRRLNVVQFVRG